ncbi:MAG: O-antigen ligase family protein [Pseudomonadota bacterium]
MIIGLVALLQFYLFYMISLVVQDRNGLIFIIFFTVLYAILFGLVLKKPLYSLYGFLFITLFFPKGGNNFVLFSIEELRGISLCTILQTVAALTICLNILRFKKRFPPIHRKLNYFCYLVFFVIILSFLLELIRAFGGDYLTNIEIVPEELVWNAPMVFGLIFLYGCATFVRRIEEAEKIFLIIIASATALAVESLLYFYLKLPLPLTNYVFHESGRYHSIFFFDFVTLALVCFGATGFILYFVSSRKTIIYLFLIPLFFLPTLATFQRTPIVSTFIVIGIFSMLRKRVRLKFGILLMGLFVWGVTLVFKMLDDYLESLAFFMFVRPDYFQTFTSSWVERLGSYLRGLEVFIASFPVGVGPGRVDPTMASSSIPKYFIDYVQAGDMSSWYHEIVSYGQVTGPHNFYVNFICEYSIWGVILIGYFVYLCFVSFKLTGKTGEKIAAVHPKLFLIKTSAYSILIAIGFWFLFYHYTFYWLMFFLLFLLFFVPDDYAKELSPAKVRVGRTS